MSVLQKSINTIKSICVHLCSSVVKKPKSAFLQEVKSSNLQPFVTSSKASEPSGLGIQPLTFLRLAKRGCEWTMGKRTAS